MRFLRVLAVAAAVLFAMLAGAGVARAQTVPRPPPEAIPVLEAVSPVTWSACNAPSQVLGFISYAQTLVPETVPIPVNPADAIALARPATATFYDTCALFPLPPPLPKCAADASFAALGSAGIPGPVAVLVLQIASIEHAVTTGHPLSEAVAEQGGCTPAPAATTPPPAESVALGSPSGGASGGSVTDAITAFAGDGLSGAPETLLDAGLEASSAADATLAADAGFPAAARHFATWVLSIAILAAAAVVTGAATAVGRLRRN